MLSLANAHRRLKGAAGTVSPPRLILMTDDDRMADPLAATLAAIERLPAGSAVIVRRRRGADLISSARRLMAPCRRRKIMVLIAGDPRLCLRLGAGGVHLSEAQARSGSRLWRLWRRPGWLVTAAAHSPAAIRRAARAGVDAVLVGPVFATESHPRAKPLGPVLFSRWTRESPLPVCALGGIGAAAARRLKRSGAAGFAGIGGIVGISAGPGWDRRPRSGRSRKPG